MQATSIRQRSRPAQSSASPPEHQHNRFSPFRGSGFDISASPIQLTCCLPITQFHSPPYLAIQGRHRHFPSQEALHLQPTQAEVGSILISQPGRLYLVHLGFCSCSLNKPPIVSSHTPIHKHLQHKADQTDKQTSRLRRLTQVPSRLPASPFGLQLHPSIHPYIHTYIRTFYA